MGKLAVAVIVSIWVIPISILVNRIVPEPYMDEIFHVPQAQQYCRGNFRSWDPMITTPPGLALSQSWILRYCLSLAYVASLFPGMSFLKAASSFSDVCFTAILRSTNGVLAVLCSTIIYDILIKLRPHLDTRKATVYTLVLTLYPLHWFFTFLYYTDIASLTAVLAVYLQCLKKNYHLSALLGAFAVFIRQTNIIWVIFVACTGVIDFTLSSQSYKIRSDEFESTITKTGDMTPDNSATVGSGVRKRKISKDGSKVKNTILKSGSSNLEAGLLEELKLIIIRSWHMKWELLVSFFPFLLVLLGFATFIYWNGSVVLGAKEAHTVSPHFAQIMYFSLFSFFATAPLHFTFSQNVELLCSIWKKQPASCFQAFVLLIAAFLAVHFYSLAHPYLLADNRHYPFYLWRKIIKAHWIMKYLLVPLYVYAWLSIFYRLGKFQKKSWIMIYFVSTAAVLIPAPLIEFRYFTIPFYFLALHIDVDDVRRWLLMGLSYVAVNALTLAIFLFKPFHWPHEPGTQRFIW